jgi:hypothetical protein
MHVQGYFSHTFRKQDHFLLSQPDAWVKWQYATGAVLAREEYLNDGVSGRENATRIISRKGGG